MKRSKGFGFVEVLCSACIFFMVIASVFKLKITMNNIAKRQKTIESYYCFLSGLKYNLLKNATYEEVKNLKENEKLNIPKEKINIDLMCSEELESVFTKEINNDCPRITMEIEDFKDESVLKIRLKMCFLVNGQQKESITEFLKGNYQ